MANLLRLPSKKIALMPDWEEKLPALVKASAHANVTNLSGVPSWFLTVIKEVMKSREVDSIHDVWPNLEVFFHGGISFAPYRMQYQSFCDMSKMHFVDTYNASEGLLGVQNDFDSNDMLLLLDTCVFYEFIPVDIQGANPVPVWELQQGRTYEVIISSCNGLWRYHLGDTVTITSLSPVKFRIAGRTKHFINAFGEELMVYNADAAVAKTSAATGMGVINYTAAPLFASGNNKASHQWFVEFDKDDYSQAQIDSFAQILDDNLRMENSDYDAKRTHSIFLDMLKIVPARRNVFDIWLRNRTGAIGGQRKIPRLSNDRTIIESLILLNEAKS
ncbi:MAG: GH3 auxin-responsive promoter family protein [Muribaculaceae bacterium]|nr:GH3 auxin-responsive promoter family protein [Muribaculaceae bacterium]